MAYLTTAVAVPGKDRVNAHAILFWSLSDTGRIMLFLHFFPAAGKHSTPLYHVYSAEHIESGQHSGLMP